MGLRLGRVIKGPPHSPTAQLTKLGWIVSGPTNTNVPSNTLHGYHVSVDDELDDIPSINTSSLSSADQECENHFLSTHSRNAHGRYIVKLPFKRSPEHLGESLPESQPEPQPVYYLPHYGVMRKHSLTTKLRVVFNGSSRTTSGVSLNDLLHTGATLQANLFDVLVWFRQFHYVFVSDMEKMYRQIKVHPKDWKF
ncbi:uncharacterized protein LOC105838606 [Monomorium pharaonis]|uniref:uncharacterized protein LOC105838606 n=1 Tax=Monomorium pharaonis TaxID=307658 RepID=UPI00063FA70D|nr:uncharacterized protein LOC105838606 [Monomorium pharaonis]